MLGRGAVLFSLPLGLVVLEDGDLAAAKDRFERKANEEFGGGGEECAEGVGGGREDGVDAEH